VTKNGCYYCYQIEFSGLGGRNRLLYQKAFGGRVLLGPAVELTVLPISIIYGGTSGTGTPYFLNFSWWKGEEFAVNRGNLWRLNYNKTVFGQGSIPDPARRAHNALSDPKSDGWIHPFRSPPFSFLDPRASCSPSELVPPLFRPKLRPYCFPTPPFRIEGQGPLDGRRGRVGGERKQTKPKCRHYI